ncbi:MAG: septum formation initiator family protein [Deltaproteobacteria bacterium]|nr:septum formation initiator family protein [Deltaproteobacteria bacterium]MBW2016787.1 septum formation initiator family protein [Deltaproteobacteria bacterium]MBW2128461.1 septum formation initiator family protein [Deltaproteobacteria bacterium]MBW2303485.1 septum formation initiator family protein [Deltaproteobacteria bacterium]
MEIKRIRLIKVLFFLLILTLIAAWLSFGEGGFVRLYRMEKEREAYVQRLRKLEEENRRLLEEIDRMRNDKEYVESVARRELNLVKDDEILYRFTKE